MPYYEYYNDSTGDTFTSEAVQQVWDEFQQECEQADLAREQMMHEEAEEQCYQEQLRQEEINRYPLFFWKKTCNKEKK